MVHPIEFGITTSISSGILPIPVGASGPFSFGGGGGATGATALLVGETDGFAIDATTDGGTISVKASSVLTSDNVPINPFLTQSGTSPKLCRHTSTLKWSPHNLAFYSEEYDNAEWAKTAMTITANDTTAPNGTTTADLITETNTSTALLRDDRSILSGRMYTLTVRVKASNIQWFRATVGDGGANFTYQYFDLTNGVLGTGTSAGTGWTYVSGAISAADAQGFRTVSYTFISGGTTAVITHRSATADDGATRVTSGAYWLWGEQLNYGPIPTDYVATTNAAKYTVAQEYDGSEFGILVEPAATNIHTRSQGTTTNWTATGCVHTANDGVAPDGSTTAGSIAASSGSAEHQIHPSSGDTISTSTTYTLSVYVKAVANVQYVYLRQFAGQNDWTHATFDLSGVSVTQSTNGSGGTISNAAITSIGSGWFRLSYAFQVASGTQTGANIGIINTGTPTPADYGNTTWTADGDEEIFWWGAQMELGTVATSHIPTGSASVTRAVDHPTLALSAIPFSATAGTWYFAMVPISAPSSFPQWVTLDDGTVNERIYVTRVTSNGNIHMPVVDGGAEQASVQNTTSTLGAEEKYAGAWAANDFAFVKNGGTVATDTSGTLPTVTTLRFGVEATGANPSNNRLKWLVYLPRRATDGELQGFSA